MSQFVTGQIDTSAQCPSRELALCRGDEGESACLDELES